MIQVPEIRILNATSPEVLDTEVNHYIERKAQEGQPITYSGEVKFNEGVYFIQMESFREVSEEVEPKQEVASE